MSEIRIAIVGVGNCASSLIQGVHYYRAAKADEFVPGLMHVKLGLTMSVMSRSLRLLMSIATKSGLMLLMQSLLKLTTPLNSRMCRRPA